MILTNGGSKPADWDQKSNAYKAGYVAGQTVMRAIEYLGALTLPWV